METLKKRAQAIRRHAVRMGQVQGQSYVAQALGVADVQKDSIDVAVLHVPTLKPLDEETILAACRKPDRLVVVAENHTVIGGLDEAVAATLLRHGVAPRFELAGLPDDFLAAGALPTLHDRYGISCEVLGHRIKGWLSRPSALADNALA